MPYREDFEGTPEPTQRDDRPAQEKGYSGKPLLSAGPTTCVGGFIIAAAVIAGAVNPLTNGEPVLGWVLVAGGIMAAVGPLLIAYRARKG